MEREPAVSIELEWSRPTQTYGELIGYRLRYGVKDQPLKEEIIKGTSKTSRSFSDLGMGKCLGRAFSVSGYRLLDFCFRERSRVRIPNIRTEPHRIRTGDNQIPADTGGSSNRASRQYIVSLSNSRCRVHNLGDAHSRAQKRTDHLLRYSVP